MNRTVGCDKLATMWRVPAHRNAAWALLPTALWCAGARIERPTENKPAHGELVTPYRQKRRHLTRPPRPSPRRGCAAFKLLFPVVLRQVTSPSYVFSAIARWIRRLTASQRSLPILGGLRRRARAERVCPIRHRHQMRSSGLCMAHARAARARRNTAGPSGLRLNDVTAR